MEDSRSTSLSAIHRHRQQAEKDAQLLANRIKRLQSEEMKTWKKIEATKKRAAQLSRNKQMYQERLAQRTELMTVKKKTENDLREKCQKLKEDRNRGRLDLRFAIFNTKREEALLTRKENAEYRRRKQLLVQNIYRENLAVHLNVLKQKSVSIEKVKRFRQMSEDAGKINYLGKIENEAKIAKKKEAEIVKLELTELELIKKLQNTHQIQEESVKRLGDALSKNVSKYFII